MIKHIRAMIAASVMLAVAACSGVPGLPNITIPTIDPVVATQIKNAVTDGCGYVPTIETILGIITTFAGGVSGVQMISQVADGICGALIKKSFRRGGKPPTYRGVVIKLVR